MSDKVKNILSKMVTPKELISFVIESYNDFISKDLPLFFEKNKRIDLFNYIKNDKEYAYKLDISNFTVSEKTIIAQSDGRTYSVSKFDAIARMAKYEVEVKCNVELIEVCVETNKEKQIHELKNKRICYLPVMVGSKLDFDELNQNDFGGYFIVKGIEKVVLSLEELGRNIVFLDNDKQLTASIYSANKEGYRYLNKVELTKLGIYFTFQPVNIKLNALTLVKALGCTDLDIINAITENKKHRLLKLLKYFELEKLDDRSEATATAKILKSFNIDTTQDTENKYVAKRLNYIFDKYLLLHIGIDLDHRKEKGLFILKMINNLFKLQENIIEPTHIDDYDYKRVKLVGSLLLEVFTVYFNKQIENFREQLIKIISQKNVKYLNLLKSEILTNGIYNAIISGNWVGGKESITSTLDRTNIYVCLSSLRRVISPLTKTQQHIPARAIHPTHRKRLDPIETPHTISCGLVKGLALGAIISKRVDEVAINRFLKQNINKVENANVFLNNKAIGHSLNVIQKFKEWRAKTKTFANYCVDPLSNEVNINTEEGRVLRPVFVIDKKKKLILNGFSIEQISLMSLEDLVEKNVIAYLDAGEEKSAIISNDISDLDADYLEITSELMFNIFASLIPFINNNGAARSSFGLKMFKQAIGKYLQKDNLTPYTRTYNMYYTQAPLVTTITRDLLKDIFDKNDVGINIVVAIMPYEGYNLEDAIIIKKSAIERGLFDSYVTKNTCVETYEDKTSILHQFLIPELDCLNRRPECDYESLDEDGIVKQNLNIKDNMAIAGKVKLPSFIKDQYALISENRYVDDTEFIRKSNNAKIKSVLLTYNHELARLAHITLALLKPVIVGDKLVSRHAQKGIIGLILEDCEMPYTANGLTPDIIISPTAFPSRLTQGHILEMLCAKFTAITGQRVNASISRDLDINEIHSKLSDNKYDSEGREVVYNPITGEKYPNLIFIGICYYMRLQHLVSEKLYFRSKGPMQLFTRQATEGKKFDGGLRLGEMERDVLISHGAANLIKERLSIDLVDQLVCENCNVFADVTFEEQTKCYICKSSKTLVNIKIPYAFRLLWDELNACHIKMKIKTKNPLSDEYI